MALTRQICILPYHFREIILTYNLTRSRTVVDLLGTCSPSGSYQSLKAFLSSLSNASPEVPKHSDLLAVFDNNQILQRRWKITLDNSVQCHVITCVLFLEIDDGSAKLQERLEYKPSQWKWQLKEDDKLAVKQLETTQNAKDIQYRRHIHPFITQALVDVVKEQRKVDEDAYEDEIDDVVKKQAHDKQYKVCPHCTFAEVPKRSKICPTCKQSCSLATLKALGVVPERHSDQQEPKAKEKGPKETRVHVSQPPEARYKFTYEKVASESAHEYATIGEKHPETPPRLIVSEPLFLNPCSLEAVAKVFREIGVKAGIHQYGPGNTKQWLVMAYHTH